MYNKKMFFFFFAVFSRAWDREKLFGLHEELNLRLADSALRCSTSEP